MPDTLADRIDALLPQTQCTRCGFDGCLPYARAIADGQAPINRCPPGGDAGIAALAALLERPPLPLDPECGAHQPLALALINEDHCIGCTLCIQACPVDAIVGANKYMHTVVADLCTGCELCVPPCPVDCIDMVPATFEWTAQHAAQARQRHQQRQARAARLQDGSQAAQAANAVTRNLVNKAPLSPAAALDAQGKQAIIAAALARARARRP
jgi:electron transport complex protein RnfB